MKSTYIYIYIYIWIIYIYRFDGHAPCRICVAKFGVKREKPNQVRLCNYSTMVDPARTLGRKVAELARDWNGEKMDQLHGTKEFCRNVCLLMGLNAMLGYIYIYERIRSKMRLAKIIYIYIYNCEKSFCNSPKMPIRIFANFESPFRTIADFSAIGFLYISYQN